MGAPTTTLIPKGFRFYKELIGATAVRFGLDPILVAAVCWQESSFNADAFRNEPDFWNRYLKANPKYRELNPRRVSSSYGLMQIMYCRVHEDKLTDNDALLPEHLFVPELNLNTGCAFLKELLEWAERFTTLTPLERLQTALSSYNGGRGGKDAAGREARPRPKQYAREVLQKYAILKPHFAA